MEEIRKMRNKIMHRTGHFDLGELASMLLKLNLSEFAPSNLPSIVSELVQNFGPSSGHLLVPKILLQLLPSIFKGRSAQSVCDPWAGLGVYVKTTETPKLLSTLAHEYKHILQSFVERPDEWKGGKVYDLKKEVDACIFGQFKSRAFCYGEMLYVMKPMSGVIPS